MSLENLNCLGGPPEFQNPLPVGQLYMPSWERYENSMRDIFCNQKYTNDGPLLQHFEKKLAAFLDVKHVICVTNATFGLMIAAEALELSGKVLVPSFTFIATALSLSRCGLEPVFCDISELTHHITPETLQKAYIPGVTAVLGVHLWGSLADVHGINQWTKRNNLKLFWDSAQAFGCKSNDHRKSEYSDVEVFSFHATKIINSSEGGCISTNDSSIAKKLRNIRSSYGSGEPTLVTKKSNTQMSEFQAALGILSLEDYSKNINHNASIRSVYSEHLSTINGVSLVPLYGISESNQQSIVITVDETVFGLSRDTLYRALHKENVIARRYFYPATHNTPEFTQMPNPNLPNTEMLLKQTLLLPIGSRVSTGDVKKICALIKLIGAKGDEITKVLN